MIRQATLFDFAWVVRNLRNSDYVGITAFQWEDDVDAWAADRFQRSTSYALIVDGVPVAVGGITPQRPGVGYAWLVATPDWCKHWREAARAVRTAIRGWFNQSDVHRLEAGCFATIPEAARFLRWLGFEFEGIQRRAGKRGEDITLWAIVR